MNQTYLFLPSVPTPNGRLHLGHIGGPYLSADICARHLRMLGHQTVIACGTDSYESYMVDQARKENLPVEKVAHKYHSAISEDLAAMHIEIDAFINPLHSQWYQPYVDLHYQLLHESQLRQATVNLSEYIPWDMETRRYLTGYALKGQCPNCNLEVAGYFCETCGAHFKPEDVKQKQVHHEKQVTNLFLHLPRQINLAANGVNEATHALYHKSYSQQNYLLRLTTHFEWGLRGCSDEQVLFSYSFIFAYFLLLGEIAGKLLGTHKNAFSSDSGVTIVSTFGIDNALPFIGSILGFTQAMPEYKAVDHYLINHFYHLNGRKFSTSRRNAIWASDIAARNMNVDIVRLYLASLDVRNKTANVTQQKMQQFHDDTAHWLSQYILKALPLLPTPDDSYDYGLIHHLRHFISMQQNVLQPDNYLPHVAVKLIQQCAQAGKDLAPGSVDYFWWLKALSVLTYPVMPALGKSLWTALGYEGEPVYAGFLALPQTAPSRQINFQLEPIHNESVITCA